MIIFSKWLNNSVWAIDWKQTSTTTLGLFGPGSNGNDEVFHIPQSSWIGASPTDGLVTYPGLSSRRGPNSSVCYIITEWFFLYKSFFVSYILSFSLVGISTIRLLVQVHRHWVQFTLARRGYDNHNRHNKPQIGNVTGVWMTSCPETMGWEFGHFEKHVSWVSAMGQSS